MTCPIAISDSTHVLNISFWMCFTLCIHLVGLNFFWNKRWYAYLRYKTFMPAEKIVTTALVCLAVSNAYAAWRIWFCNNWDTTDGVIILTFYFFMIITEALFFPAIMLSQSAILAIVISLISLCISITFAVLSEVLVSDFWACVVGIADSFVCAILLLFAINVQYQAPALYTEYESKKPEIKRKYESAPKQGYSTVPSDTTPVPAQPSGAPIGQSLNFRSNAARSYGNFTVDESI